MSVRTSMPLFALALVASAFAAGVASAKENDNTTCERYCGNDTSYACYQACNENQPTQLKRKRGRPNQPTLTHVPASFWRDAAFGTGEGGSGGGGGGRGGGRGN